MSESPRLINANSISKINRGWLTEHQNWPFHIKNSKFILEFLLVGLCQSVKNLNGLYNLHSPFSFACNFQVESTPAFFKRKICLSLSTKTTELLNPQNERTVKEHSILHLRASPSPLKTFPQLNKLENHDDAELWSAVQHLPEMRKYDLIWQVEWSRVLSWIWSASYRASFVGKCPPCPILLPVTALKKRQFISPQQKRNLDRQNLRGEVMLPHANHHLQGRPPCCVHRPIDGWISLYWFGRDSCLQWHVGQLVSGSALFCVMSEYS